MSIGGQCWGPAGRGFFSIVSYYSIVVFSPVIVENIFGKSGMVDIQLNCAFPLYPAAVPV